MWVFDANYDYVFILIATAMIVTACHRWCVPNRQPWSTKCTWTNRCDGCSACAGECDYVCCCRSFKQRDFIPLDFTNGQMFVKQIVLFAYTPHTEISMVLHLWWHGESNMCYKFLVLIPKISFRYNNGYHCFPKTRWPLKSVFVLLLLPALTPSSSWFSQRVINGAFRIVNRGPQNANGQIGATVAPLVPVSSYISTATTTFLLIAIFHSCLHKWHADLTPPVNPGQWRSLIIFSVCTNMIVFNDCYSV